VHHGRIANLIGTRICIGNFHDRQWSLGFVDIPQLDGTIGPAACDFQILATRSKGNRGDHGSNGSSWVDTRGLLLLLL
jgi:hypothetical protein